MEHHENVSHPFALQFGGIEKLVPGVNDRTIHALCGDSLKKISPLQCAAILASGFRIP